MRRLRVGAAILNQTPLDWQGNTERILAAVEAARNQNVNVLCLPELCLTGYGCEDMFLSPHTWKMAWQQMLQVLPRSGEMILCVGMPLFVTNGVYNVACVISGGRIVGFVPKQNLAGDGLHYEPRWFRAWPAETVSEFNADGHDVPIGDLIFERDGVRIGFEICEDAWVADRPGSRMARSGVDIILNPSASHFAFGKHEIRKRFVLEGSRAFGVSYVYANLLGNEAGRAIYDGGALIAASGEMVAAGKRFGFEDWDLTVADIDVDLTRNRRASIHSMPADIDEGLHDRIVRVPGHLPSVSGSVNAGPLPPAGPEGEFDEFTQAVSLALFDYMRKSFSNGFIVSMSGGADSSATACLIHCMVERAVDSLGLDGFNQKLQYIQDLNQAANCDEIMLQLFTGVYQRTRNSSETTRAAAEAVTRGVGGKYHELDIDNVVQSYVSIIEQALGSELTWASHDVTLQNIQARSRAPSIWMFANLKNALLLSTSNRSEAAVGYATMDGDTSGGLSPIAGIDKAFLRDWLQVMETAGSGGCQPIPTLSLVNQQQPTAELRPIEFAQTDEKDLMPYPLLDEIEGLAIRDKFSPGEVLETLLRKESPYSREQLAQWVTRFFRLWSRNQWKRERYAPSFHVDDKNLDPRTWCRFPILSGGFRMELEQLDR
jgi:NAD+ synthase (glutamine-hydrolysing)